MEFWDLHLYTDQRPITLLFHNTKILSVRNFQSQSYITVLSVFLQVTDDMFTGFRISYCSADATHDRVFAFIATNSNETMECHAFLCPKRKMVSENKLSYIKGYLKSPHIIFNSSPHRVLHY